MMKKTTSNRSKTVSNQSKTVTKKFHDYLKLTSKEHQTSNAWRNKKISAYHRTCLLLQANPRESMNIKDFHRNFDDICSNSLSRYLSMLSKTSYVKRVKIDGLFHYNLTNTGMKATTSEIVNMSYNKRNEIEAKLKSRESKDDNKDPGCIDMTGRTKDYIDLHKRFEHIQESSSWSVLDFVGKLLQDNRGVAFTSSDITEILCVGSKFLSRHLADHKRRKKRGIQRKRRNDLKSSPYIYWYGRYGTKDLINYDEGIYEVQGMFAKERKIEPELTTPATDSPKKPLQVEVDDLNKSMKDIISIKGEISILEDTLNQQLKGKMESLIRYRDSLKKQIQRINQI
jgi:DNA-binding HxlR family transcriptional regulator